MTHGATPDEWLHFDLMLGLTRDLLPVVSNPYAEISPDSKMKALGKTPSRYNREGHVVGFPKWTEWTSLGVDLAAWSSQPDYGICIQTRHVRALDIDVPDNLPAQQIEDAWHQALGIDCPIRMRDNSGKRLLAFIVEGELPKRRMTVEGGIIEMLANGQQFVAAGEHPSGARYTWSGGLPSSFPVITLAQLDAAWQALAERFAIEPPTSSGGLRRRGEDLTITDPVVDHLFEAGLVLDTGRDGQVYVECPWSSQHTQDNGPTQTSWMAAGSNGYERGHFSCLHAHCQGRTDSEFKAAIGFDETEFGPVVEERPALPPASALAHAWVYREPSSIPPRRWLYGNHYIRQFLSTTVAPGGSGKSALALLEAMAMASGKALLGVEPVERAKVWYFNGEDPLEETERRIAAACMHYGLTGADLEGWLFIGSGRDADLVMASQDRQGIRIHDPVVDLVTGLIRSLDISLAIVDPFVSSHRVTENDNGAIDQVAKRWGRIADSTGCAVELVHHVRKGQAGIATTVEDGRGASALLAAARSARVLNAMTQAEADKARVTNPRSYFRVSNGKANLAPPADASDWFRFRSIELGNGELGGGDSVGVVTKWEWPADVEDDGAAMNPEDIAAVQTALATNPQRCRADRRSSDWFGYLIGEVLDFNMADKDVIKCVQDTISQWVNAGFFTSCVIHDSKRRPREAFKTCSAPLF